MSGGASGRVAYAVVALTLIVPWYAGFGRRLMTSAGGGRPAVVFAVGLIALFVAAIALDVSASYALFAICPMLLMSLATGPALAIVLLANLLPTTVVWLTTGSRESALGLLPAALLNIALAVLLGLWITRMARQSRERARLIEELRRSRAEVAQLSHQAGIAAERERLAREIHDTVAQGLTSIIGLVQAAESELADAPDLARRHLGLAARAAKENLAETREFVAALTPIPLRDNPLPEAVRRQADALAAETGLSVRYAATGAEFPVPTAVGVVLLRAAQESLANIRRHAGAVEVSVRLDYGDSGVRLTVADDGGGFEVDPDREGFGLRGLRGRVADIGGAVTVTSDPGVGTVVEVVVPLRGPEGAGVAEVGGDA
ncbi:sensor histidine kinase [Solihabitans fulvus]|uniref:Sensor histidine kinase n=2 Tax=Solihabitans fulvus TaxID=1892852 RepID=A0A5B2XW28_9PSEU|nr:sensor histidine kinase [Solihabitans fulvus]